MGLLRKLRQRRSQQSNAAMVMPQSRPEAHVHQAKSYALEILAGFLAVFLGLVGLWLWFLDILRQADIELSRVINAVGLFIGGIAFLFFFYLAGLLATKVLNAAKNEEHRRKMELEEALYQRLMLQHQIGVTVNDITGTISLEQKRFNSILVQVVDDVYMRGEFTREGKNAWARNNAGTMIPTGESQPVGAYSQIIKDVQKWLRDNDAVIGPIKNEQWNFSDYPTRESVLKLLRIPAVVQAGGDDSILRGVVDKR